MAFRARPQRRTRTRTGRGRKPLCSLLTCTSVRVSRAGKHGRPARQVQPFKQRELRDDRVGKVGESDENRRHQPRFFHLQCTPSSSTRGIVLEKSAKNPRIARFTAQPGNSASSQLSEMILLLVYGYGVREQKEIAASIHASAGLPTETCQPALDSAEHQSGTA
eukprot:755099-Hanusia_phi.AAC.1